MPAKAGTRAALSLNVLPSIEKGRTWSRYAAVTGSGRPRWNRAGRWRAAKIFGEAALNLYFNCV